MKFSLPLTFKISHPHWGTIADASQNFLISPLGLIHGLIIGRNEQLLLTLTNNKKSPTVRRGGDHGAKGFCLKEAISDPLVTASLRWLLRYRVTQEKQT
jgi:hypothetical protein